MKAMQLRALVRWLLVASLWVGCLSPTLPIPPPDSAVASVPDLNGEVTVSGGAGSAQSGAIISVWNSNYVDPTSGTTGTGVDQPVATDGSWTAQIHGKSGDLLYIHQSYDGETSPDLYVYVPSTP